MLSMFFWTQWRCPCKGDWVQLVQQDLTDFEIPLDVLYLRAFTKYSFKKYVKKKATEYCLRILTSRKEAHSKLKSLTYSSLEIQEYLVSPTLTIHEVRTIFLFRTRMQNFWGNFRGTDEYRLCPLCNKHPDKQELFSKCYVIRNEFGDIEKEIKSVQNRRFLTENAKLVVKSLNLREKRIREMEG